MGAADVATVLFTQFLKFDPLSPKWPDRDRFVLSAGHGSMLMYALLYLTGYKSVTIDEIKRFRQSGSKTPGHPENFITEGVETTTGPLGQGLANAVGMAMAERHMAAVFGDAIVDHKTYVLASDGDLMEGISQEAISLAGHLKLSKLIVLFDDNGISIDGALSLSDSTDQVKRFEASNWNAVRIDGHDQKAIAAALTKAQTSDKPTLIACRTRSASARRPRPASRRRTVRRSAPTRSRARAKRSAGPRRRSKCRTKFSHRGARPANVRAARMPIGTNASPRSTKRSRLNSLAA